MSLLGKDEDGDKVASQFSIEATRTKEALGRDPKDGFECPATAATFLSEIENPAKKQKCPPRTATA